MPPDLIRAKDGWVYVMRIVPKDELFVMIERPDLMERGFSVDIPTWNTAIPEIFEAVQEWAYDKTVAEIVELGQLLRVAVTPVVDGGDVLADEQLAARDWWEREGDTAFPGQPYKFTATPGGAARSGAGDRRPVGHDAARRLRGDRRGERVRRVRPARCRASASSRSRRTGPVRSPAASSPTSAPTTSRSSGPPARRRGP